MGAFFLTYPYNNIQTYQRNICIHLHVNTDDTLLLHYDVKSQRTNIPSDTPAIIHVTNTDGTFGRCYK